MSGLITVVLFLVSLVFSVLIFLLWARIGMHYYRVSSLHPVSKAINTLLNPLVKPFTYLPKLKSKSSRIDFPAFALLIVVELIKFTLLGLLFFRALMPFLFLLLFVAADLIVQPLVFLFYAILVRVIMSWVNPSWQNPIAYVLTAITEPVLRIGRRYIPSIAGFDFSPFVVIVVIQMIILFIRSSLPFRLI